MTRIDQTFNGANQLVGQRRYSDAAGTDLVAATAYTYDPWTGQQTSIVTKNAAATTTLASFDSTYNLAGEVASESDYQVGLDSSLSDPVVSDYAYDSQGQVTQDGTGSYAYSGTNRSAKTVGIATTSYTTANDQLTTDGTWSYFYDAAGNQVKKVNILSTDPDYGKAWTYTFNYENQLISAKEYSSDPDVSGSSPTLLTEVDYVYDVYGNRIQTSTGGGAAYVAPVETTEYANSVVAFSSQYSSTSWSAAQATGAPNVTGTQHDDANAWAALDPNNATEYLELGYATAINVDSVTITESDDAGFVTEIDLIEPDGTSHSFTGIVDSSSSSGAIVDFTYTLSSETSYPVDKVKIVINGLHTTGWEEIDAVQIHGYTPAVGTFDDPVVTKYALDGWNPAKSNPVGNEDTSVWADINGDGSLATHYMLGDQVDQILARVDVTAPSDSTTGAKWYLTDQQGSLRTLLNASGSEIVSLRYDAFGNVADTDVPNTVDDPLLMTNVAGRYQWTGREVDAETGLQYNRARWYDSSTGRWISQDPMGFDAGDSNLYRYAFNSPTNHTDPSGLEIPPPGLYDESAQALAKWHKGRESGSVEGPIEGKKALYDFQYTDFNDEELTKLKASVPYAREILTKAVAYVQTPGSDAGLNKFFGNGKALTPDQKNLVLDTYRKALNAFDQKMYFVNEYSNEVAYTIPGFPRYSRNIYFGTGFFKAGPLNRAGIIVHELTHIWAGTADNGYLVEFKRGIGQYTVKNWLGVFADISTLTISQLLHNASTYENYITTEVPLS